MNLNAFQQWLNTFLNFEKTPQKDILWLDGMKFLCNKLGNPQNDIPCIHVAGSKGKGSVSNMIANIINANGYKCGLYSSPHIIDFRERISTPTGFFDENIYETAADELYECVKNIKQEELPGKRNLTWFELVTAFAFVCFKKAQVDYVVYEVGLGGRLDSTNVITPLCSVLMPIELEHTDFLGDTITKIAKEKAGIIKKNIPCIISFQNYKEAEEVFTKTAKSKHSEYFFVKEQIKTLSFYYNKDGTMHTSFIWNDEDFNLNLKLLGKVQAENACTATLVAKKIFPNISNSVIKKGLESAFLPGRFELHNNIILDGAHTVKSIQNTLNTLKDLFPVKNHYLLFACAGDKDIKDITLLFKDKFKDIIFTQPKSVRHCDSDKTFEIAKQNGIKAQTQKDLKTAFLTLKSHLKNDDILLITGSFYLISEVKSLLGNEFI